MSDEQQFWRSPLHALRVVRRHHIQRFANYGWYTYALARDADSNSNSKVCTICILVFISREIVQELQL